MRLEQGRETNPSPQVVDARGRALRLGADARTHLFRLAGINPRTKADSFRDQIHPDLPRILFTHPRAREVFPDWQLVTSATVYALHLNAARSSGAPEIGDLVQELLEASEEFRALWNDQTVGTLTRAHKVFVHPEVGRIELTYQSFDVHDAPGQELAGGFGRARQPQRGGPDRPCVHGRSRLLTRVPGTWIRASARRPARQYNLWGGGRTTI
ncbi:hypothetical protein ACFV2U_27930 [Streptomyces sp. NPDC059697]|uniref:MmyB family transcriptional regulator n=1 Tax=Streptomyces sp. NPDC059697 TaxID=3346912 RepID=UPI0036816FC8